MAPDLGLTLKLTHLPAETTESDVRRYLQRFPGMKNEYDCIKKVSEPCQYSHLAGGYLSSVVTLKTQKIAKRLYDSVTSKPGHFTAERGHGFSTPAIDSAFLDLTTLYYSTKGPGGVPTVE